MNVEEDDLKCSLTTCKSHHKAENICSGCLSSRYHDKNCQEEHIQSHRAYCISRHVTFCDGGLSCTLPSAHDDPSDDPFVNCQRVASKVISKIKPDPLTAMFPDPDLWTRKILKIGPTEIFPPHLQTQKGRKAFLATFFLLWWDQEGKGQRGTGGYSNSIPYEVGSCCGGGSSSRKVNLRFCSICWIENKHGRSDPNRDIPISRAAIAILFQLQTICAYCNEELSTAADSPLPRPSIDAMLPTAAGGLHIRGNTIVVCQRCNSLKSIIPLRFFFVLANKLGPNFWRWMRGGADAPDGVDDEIRDMRNQMMTDALGAEALAASIARRKDASEQGGGPGGPELPLGPEKVVLATLSAMHKHLHQSEGFNRRLAIAEAERELNFQMGGSAYARHSLKWDSFKRILNGGARTFGGSVPLPKPGDKAVLVALVAKHHLNPDLDMRGVGNFDVYRPDNSCSCYAYDSHQGSLCKSCKAASSLPYNPTQLISLGYIRSSCYMCGITQSEHGALELPGDFPAHPFRSFFGLDSPRFPSLHDPGYTPFCCKLCNIFQGILLSEAATAKMGKNFKRGWTSALYNLRANEEGHFIADHDILVQGPLYQLPRAIFERNYTPNPAFINEEVWTAANNLALAHEARMAAEGPVLTQVDQIALEAKQALVDRNNDKWSGAIEVQQLFIKWRNQRWD
jgi:hypothetical protein